MAENTFAPIICSTARLARSLKMAQNRVQRDKERMQWQPVEAVTLGQWLSDVLDIALLNGDIDANQAPRGALSLLQERVLWELAIDSALGNDNMQALFDKVGMASAAQEANRLLIEWNIRLGGGEQTEETRQFMIWRESFNKLCKQSGWLDALSYLNWQIACLQAGAGQLPPQINLAGFDRISPQAQRLLDVLSARGVVVERHMTGLPQASSAAHVRLTDRDAECRAAVAWAQQQLQQNPSAKLAIVVPELGALRHRLAALLDDVLHPASVTPLLAESPRCYDFSLGLPLSAQPVIATALSLLHLVSHRNVQQADFTALLHQPYWSASLSEADARARLDARMREWLPLTFSQRRLMRFILKNTEGEHSLSLLKLVDDMQALLAAFGIQPNKQPPSAWALAFKAMLQAASWPGERSLSSHEYQAQQAFDKALQSLGELDGLLGQLDSSHALHRLNQLCREQIFQPEAQDDLPLQVMGMLEVAGAPLDAIWVMGMNDHVWPPPPRPNPLLPAAIQRAAGTPNADSAVQAEFAAAIHHRLMHSARQVVFSSAVKEGDRQLRASPLLSDVAEVIDAIPLAATLAEKLAANAAKNLSFEDDRQAPPVASGEHIAGGTGLLKAQAICPAWAFYQYRLWARALKQPVNGLEASERGTLVHGVLEHFWQDRGLAELQAMSSQVIHDLVLQAADNALADFSAQRDEPLAPAFVALERERLTKLVMAWLVEVELNRPQSFYVTAREQEQTLTIEGVEIRLVVDRIDMLEDGRLVLMDYKTGLKTDYTNWADSRITEPQLPIYAAFALSNNEVAAVCFARVRVEEHGFSGIAADADVVQGAKVLDEKKGREIFPQEQFPDWRSLLIHWKTSIEAIVRELKAGEAAVCFSDEKQLTYCEVLPLLRLPERQLQFERLQALQEPGA